MIPKKRRRNNRSSNSSSIDRVGLSYRSYLKKQNITKNIDYELFNLDDVRSSFYGFEYSKGGSYTKIVDDVIDPYTTDELDKYKDRPKRGSIQYFSRRSRGRLLELVSKLNKSKVDPKTVLFITLTSPSVGWRDVSGEEWKTRLNNFLTQLRQKFGTDSHFCGIWRLEFQKRGSPHFHLVTYNIPYIDHQWVSEKWNKICCVRLGFKEKMKHLKAGTQVEIGRDWGSVKDYFSKTMSYVCKDENWKHQSNKDKGLLDWMKGFGRHWGVIRRDNLKKLIEVVTGEFKTKEQYHKVRRVFRKYIQSTRKRKLGDNYNKKQGKVLDRIFSQKCKSKHKCFIPDTVFEELMLWVGIDVSTFNCNSKEIIPSLE